MTTPQIKGYNYYAVLQKRFERCADLMTYEVTRYRFICSMHAFVSTITIKT